MKKHKTLGQVYTPNHIVNNILDRVGYKGSTILDKKIFEPSVGDGAFLINIITRYISQAKKKNYKDEKIKEGLQAHIYGVEIDKTEYKKCIKNLDNLVNKLLVIEKPIKWKVYLGDTLDLYKKWHGKFDFVVGNPPYIRIHNLDLKTRKVIKENFRFNEGTIDIYLSFFELGLYCLKADGYLGYITPNSYMHNSSYKKFRFYIKERKILYSLTDFKSNKMFEGYSTYTAITILSNMPNSSNKFSYSELQENKKVKVIANIDFKYLDDNDWSFSNEEDIKFINQLKKNRKHQVKEYFNVQYGFATLRDSIFISEKTELKNDLCVFNDMEIEKDLVHKIVKGSTYKGNPKEIKYIIYPYKKVFGRYEVVPEEIMRKDYPLTYKYFLHFGESLKERSMDAGAIWYEFGRSQGVQTIHNKKIVIPTLTKDSILFYKIPSDVMVYSGIYITKREEMVEWNDIIDVLKSDNFKRFIKITGKNFSGGYKSITTTQIKDFNIEKLESSQLKLDI